MVYMPVVLLPRKNKFFGFFIQAFLKTGVPMCPDREAIGVPDS
jgi:hypothetical protein